MRKDLALSLKANVDQVARIFSNPSRSCNGNAETFSVDKIIPLSENVALAIYNKLPSNKRAVCVFLWINAGEGFWQHFFPTYDQIAGLNRVDKYLHDTEIFNFDKNGGC